MPDEQRTIVREGLQRTTPFTLERAAGDSGDGLTLEGHAAVFNSPTVIDSWEGRFKEQTARGAFKKTFAERTPVLQFDHGHHPLIGSIPIGRINSAREDTTGAAIKARLADNWLIQPVRDAIANESINGMSFRFGVVQEEWRDVEGNLVTDPNKILQAIYRADGLPEDQLWTRTLREVKVPELGPVVFPAYADTDVGVRSGTTVIDLGQLRRDPQAREQLGRALWMAEQPAPDAAPDAAPDVDPAGTGPVINGTPVINVFVTGDRSAAEIAEEVTRHLRAAGFGGNGHTPAHNEGDDPANLERDAEKGTEPAGDGHSEDRPDADGAHRASTTPAPASERHADTDGEPPDGHSPSPAPDWASDPRARKAHMAYVREMSKASTDRRAVYERTVTQWEADQRASGDQPSEGEGRDQSSSSDSGDS